MTQPTTKAPSQLALERFVAGDASPDQAARVREWLAQEPAAQAAVAAIVQNNAEVLAQYPPRVMAAAIRTRAERTQPRAQWAALRLAGAAAAAAIAVAVLWPASALDPAAPATSGPPTETRELTRLKGGAPSLQIYRLTERGAEALDARSVLAPGDRLQLEVQAANSAHVVVLSLDGRGATTLHYPESERATTAWSGQAQPVPLPHSYELDDAPQFERFFIVASNAPIDVAAVLRAARGLAEQGSARSALLALPADMTQSSIVLSKEVSP
jgi:hypothetical protein